MPDDKVKVKVTQTGRFKPPNLSDPQLKIIGERMLIEQKTRWAISKNADGNQAKKLSVKYFFEKRKVRGGSPVRDMYMTGVTEKNFQLRKAADNTIRAENTSRSCRDRAKRCQMIDEMIGFAGTDQIAVFKESQKQYGNHLIRAFVPLS